jgi:membrane-bound lytic murein transglycosylase D
VSTTRRTKLLVAALLAVAGRTALAVDPLLHDDPAFTIQSPATPLLGIEPAESTAGVEVRDIQDLGPKPAADATPGDLWDRIRTGFAMPDLVSPVVVQRQAWYAQRPEQLRIFVDRSRKYMFHIVEALERRGMPTELALLPMVESAYNPMAYSRAHASGLWQFIPSTGRNYNLDQNFWYDARRDILASTNAALDYLQSLHDMFGDWHLALAAYNMGENGVQRAIDRNRAQRKPADYQSISMPRETRAYVPSFQALKNIVKNPGAAGVQLDPIPNAPYFVTVTLTRDIDLRVAAKLAEMPVEELVTLNPGHNRPVVAAEHAPQLILPADRAEAFVQNLERHDKPLSSWQIHTFRAGEKLDRLAAEHGLSVERLRAINGLGPKGTVVVGQQIVLPQKGSSAGSEPLPFTPSGAARTASYVVKLGDTWSGVAAAFGVAIADLKRVNEGAQLVPGERLVVEIRPKKVITKRAKQPVAKKAQPAAGRSTATTAPARPSAPAQVARPSPSSAVR